MGGGCRRILEGRNDAARQEEAEVLLRFASQLVLDHRYHRAIHGLTLLKEMSLYAFLLGYALSLFPGWVESCPPRIAPTPPSVFPSRLSFLVPSPPLSFPNPSRRRLSSPSTPACSW